MRSPWLIHTVWCSPGFQTPSNSGEALSTLKQRPAELAVVPALDGPAELLGHRHLAVADAEHRHAGLKNLLRGARRIAVRHGGGAAGEDDAFGLQPGKSLGGVLERHDLRVDASLAHAPRDQLRDLAAEVDDQDGGVFLSGGVGGWVGHAWL